MKKLTILCIAVFSISFVQAALITVSNNTENPAQYTSFQTAIDEASSGDTLVVYGSPDNYGDISVNKELYILGPGHDPQGVNKQPATIDDITIQGAASGSVIEGLFIGDRIRTTGSAANVTFTKNRFDYNYGIINNLDNNNNWKFIGNYIDGYLNVIGESNRDWQILNNVFWGGSYSGVYNTNSTTLIFNNYFEQDLNFFNSCSKSFFANNIFNYNGSSESFNPSGGCTECIFSNNLVYSQYYIDNGLTLPNIVDENNYGGQNLMNVNPAFIGDCHELSESSPGKSAGSDNTDLGLYGRGYIFNCFGHPNIPMVTNMDIENAVVPINETINVNVSVTTEN